MSIRASDEDRNRTLAALERHTGAGRLTLDEFADRVQAACAARTVEELAAVVSDLPGDTADGPRRELLVLFAVAALTLVLLFVFLALTR